MTPAYEMDRDDRSASVKEISSTRFRPVTPNAAALGTACRDNACMISCFVWAGPVAADVDACGYSCDVCEVVQSLSTDGFHVEISGSYTRHA